MAKKQTIAVLLLVLCAGVFGQSCFDTTNKQAPESVSLLKGDHYIINLDYYSTQSNLEYTVDAIKTGSDKEEDKAYLDVTGVFPPQGQVSKLAEDDSIKKCVAKTRGINEFEFVFLCDDTKIVKTSVHRSNGSIAETKVLKLTEEAGITCLDTLSSKLTNTVYTVCTQANKDKPENTDILVYKTQLLTETTQAPLVIKQENTKQVLKNLKLMIDEQKFDGGSDVILYLWEKNSADFKVKFRLIKDKIGTLVDGGYYSTENGSTKGLTDGRLISVFHDGVSVLLTTRTSEGKTFVQRCHRSPVYSKYMCHKETLTELENATDLVYYFPLKGTRFEEGSAHLGVYSVSKSKLIVGTLDDTGSKLVYKQVEQGTTELTGTKFKSVNAAYFVNDVFFIVGSTTDDSSVIDGVMKFKPNSNTFDDYDYRDSNPTLAMVVEDKLQKEFNYFVTLGEGKLNFYHVMYNHLIINTKGFTDNLDSLDVTINCKSASEAKGTLKLTVETQMQVNDNPQFAVTEVTAYAGSKHLSIPTNGADIQGNAPQITVTSELGEQLKLKTNLVDKMTSTYKGKAINDIVDHKHIGEGVFAVWTKNSVNFIRCGKVKGTQAYECDTLGNEVVLDKSINYLASTSSDNIILTVVSTTKTNEKGQLLPPSTYIKGFSARDGQNLFEPFEIAFASTLAVVRLDGKVITVIVVGSEQWDQPQGLYSITFRYDSEKMPTAFKKFMDLASHVCPTELWWAPKLGNELYIASVCGDSSLDNHVFSYAFFNGKITSETSAIKITGSKNFNICAQPHLVNVVDKDQVTLFSYTRNPATNTNKVLNLPLHRYGLDQIIDHACDENAGLMQIVGCKTEGLSTPQCKVITYRADEQKRPNRRVHSIVAIGANIKRVETTYNDDDDLAQMLALGDSTASFELFTIESEGPHLDVDALATSEAKTVELKWKVSFPGAEEKDTKTIEVPQTVNFVRQQTTVTVSTLNDSKRVVPDGSMINLDEILNITGPYHSLVAKQIDGVSVIDRLTPSNQFNETTQTFKDAILHRQFAFGTVTLGQLTDIVLVKDGAVLAKVENKPNIELFVIEVTKEKIFFFAHSKQELKHDELVVFFTKDGGATWKTDVKSLGFEGYKHAEIIMGYGDGFVFGGYNNRHSFSIDLKTFKINKEDKIEFSWNKNAPLTFKHPIADFSMVWLMDSTSVIVVVGAEYSKEGHFYRYRMDDEWTLMLGGSTKAGLVPNVKAVHKDVVFMCTEGPEDAVINCVHSGKNKNSYVTRFEFDFSNNGIEVKSDRVVAYLNNIVNLKPIRLDFEGDLIAITAKNQNVLKADQKPTHNSLLTDNYVVLVYKIDSRTFSAKESFDNIHVYKILTAADFGVKADADLSNLDPRFFLNKDGAVKLGVNVGSEKKSLKVFNMDPLTLIAPASAAANGDLELFSIQSLSSEAVPVKASHVIKSSSNPDEPTKPKKRNTTLLIIVIVASILVVLLIVVGIIKVKKDEETAEGDLNLDDAEKTMKFNNDESASGNYSKL